ncbi:MAG: tetratricopeptide repeat-containing protein [Proteobacteria bacterium]|nr:tetratricopeptide repeat-containing protein [Pseudomonadota bacterium]
MTRRAYRVGDLTAEWQALVARTDADGNDAGAWLDMAICLQTVGQRDKALAVQEIALGLNRWYRIRFGSGTAPRVLAFVTPGDLMANTPLDFLLTGSDADLYLCYVGANTPLPTEVPDHDIAVVAVGQSDANAPLLHVLERWLANWPRPVINGNAGRIAALSRDGVSASLASESRVIAAPTLRAGRDVLAGIAAGTVPLDAIMADLAFPIILRPLDTHAGQGMEKLDDAAAVAGYLARHADASFFVVPFVDYAGEDGLFRKHRIAIIDGRPFPSHLAVSSHWMVHYLSAGMTEDAGKRAQEAHWMETFDADFAARHAEAFAALHRRLQLDYVVIDSAETRDGRLLLFEADVAMIVHDMDSETVFPYKKPAMRRLFAAFQQLLAKRAGR